MTNPFELPKELLHEIIMRTIEIDNISNKIIRESFGLDLKFGDEKDNCKPLNMNRIFRFNEFFLVNFGASSRADLLFEIIKEINKQNKEELRPEGDFKGDLIKFYKIRDIFAHNLYPKDLKGITRLESSEPYWGELNKQHLELYNKLKEFLTKMASIKQKEN
ncbi:MAG: hypothetical protein Q7S06_02505 [Nanoarchaeota archaeon]|nr:hypothetical protein [Nanoarchaeota archaeon]